MVKLVSRDKEWEFEALSISFRDRETDIDWGQVTDPIHQKLTPCEAGKLDVTWVASGAGVESIPKDIKAGFEIKCKEVIEGSLTEIMLIGCTVMNVSGNCIAGKSESYRWYLKG